EKCREPLRRRHGAEHTDTLTREITYGFCLNGLGRYADAEAVYAPLLPLLRRVQGPEAPGTQMGLSQFALALNQQGKYDAEEPVLGELLEVRRKPLPTGHGQVGEAERRLGVCLARQHHFEAAEPLLLAGHDHLVQARNPAAADVEVRAAVKALA